MPCGNRLIFLHGLGDSGNGWASIAENFRLRRKFNEVAFIFPHAPTIPITCNMGWRMPGWYDIKDFGHLNMEDDEEGMLKSVELINKIIKEQVDHGIDSKRIIVGGFSQGGAIAILTGLMSKCPLGGIAALSSYLPLHKKISSMVTDKGRELPVFMGHGKRDSVVRYGWGVMSRDFLKEMGLNVTWKEYNDLEHSASPTEITDFEQWMEQKLEGTQ